MDILCMLPRLLVNALYYTTKYSKIFNNLIISNGRLKPRLSSILTSFSSWWLLRSLLIVSFLFRLPIEIKYYSENVEDKNNNKCTLGWFLHDWKVRKRLDSSLSSIITRTKPFILNFSNKNGWLLHHPRQIDCRPIMKTITSLFLLLVYCEQVTSTYLSRRFSSKRDDRDTKYLLFSKQLTLLCTCCHQLTNFTIKILP